MSGTDYLLTPNLGLYKPIYDHDVENWGTHLNANADALDAAFSPTAGVFLPLTGGTISGNTTISNASLLLNYAQNATSRGGYYSNFEAISGSLSGAATNGADQAVSLLQITSDTMDAGAAGLIGHYIKLTAGGTGTAGNRLGQYIDTQFTGSTLDKARGWPGMYGGQWIYAKASGNVGGTALNNAYGTLWGGLSSATLQSGATFWSYAIGHEINVGVSAGASAPFVQGLKIALQNHNQASNATDYLIGLAKVALSDAQVAYGISFGSPDGYWPITSGGTLIGTTASVLATPPAMTAANGIDFSAVTFSNAFLNSNGFSVNGTGYVTAAGGAFSYGQTFTGALPASQTDLTHHIKLFDGGAGNQLGLSVSWPGSGNSHLNYVVGINADHEFLVNGAVVTSVTATGLSVTGAISATGGHHCGSTVASGVSDFSKQIDLYGGQSGITITSDTNMNYVGFSSGYHVFYLGATQVGFVGPTSITSASAIQCGGNAGPTWTTGTAAPASTQPVGSLYSRVGGAVGATLYVSRGAGTWAAVSGV